MGLKVLFMVLMKKSIVIRYRWIGKGCHRCRKVRFPEEAAMKAYGLQSTELYSQVTESGGVHSAFIFKEAQIHVSPIFPSVFCSRIRSKALLCRQPLQDSPKDVPYGAAFSSVVSTGLSILSVCIHERHTTSRFSRLTPIFWLSRIGGC